METPHHQIEADWMAPLYEDGTDPAVAELPYEDLQLVRYNAGLGIWVLATKGEGNTLKLYKVEQSEPRVTLLHLEESGEQECKWVHLDLSPDGNVVAAGFGVFAVAAEGSWRPPKPGSLTYLALQGGRLTFRAEDLAFSLDHKWENETEQFFAVLHPDNRHGFFWTYGKSRLSVVDILTGEVTASKVIDTVSAMNVSENGGCLLVSRWGNALWTFRLPGLELDLQLYHGYGYGWAPIGIAMNAREDLAIAFTGHSRHLPIDYNCQVTDWDSHLILWQKQADGEWEDIDAIHFLQNEHRIDAFGRIAVRAAGNKLYWAGEVNPKEILWMELPSQRKCTVKLEHEMEDLFFGSDGGRLYWTDWVGTLFALELPIERMEGVEVVKLEYRRQALDPPPEMPLDWQQHWDAGKACLDLTGTAFRSLDFLHELPDIEMLILDGSDVLTLPDLSAMTRLRILSCNHCLIQDFQPLAELSQLAELSMQRCAMPDMEWMRGLTGLRKLDLSHTAVTEIDTLRGLRQLEWLSLADTWVTDIGPLEGLPLRHLDLTKARVLDLRAISGTSTLETLISNWGTWSSFTPSPAWKSLRRLELWNAVIDEGSLASLPSLEWLDVSRSDLHDFSFLASLPNLRHLDVSSTSFGDASPLARCSALESLNLRTTHLRIGLEALEGKPLKELRLNANAFADLRPLQSLKCLETLEVNMSACWEAMAGILEGLPLLTRLQIEGVRQGFDLRNIDFLRPLQRLKHLYIYADAIADLAPVAELASMEHLHISAREIKNAASLSGLKALRHIQFSRLDRHSTKRLSLPDLFSALPKVAYFEAPMAYFESKDFLDSFTEIRELKLSSLGESGQGFLQRMPHLQALHLDADMMDPLPTLPELRVLEGIDLRNGDEWPKLPRLKKVGYVCAQPAQLDAFWSLRELTVDGQKIRDLRALPPIPSLRRLTVYNFSGAQLAGLEQFAGLEELTVSESELDSFPDLAGLPCLHILHLKKVKVVDPANMGSLRHLRILHTEEIACAHYKWLGHLEELRDLELDSPGYVQPISEMPISGLWTLRKLQSLHLKTALVQAIPDWAFMRSVQDAWLEIPKLASLPPFPVDLPHLRKLRLICRNAVDFSFLAHCQGLRELKISCQGFHELELLTGTLGLRELGIHGTSVTSLVPILPLKGLRKIDFGDTQVADLEPVAHLPALERLDFEGVKVPTYAPLAPLQQLRWIAGDLPADRDLSMLADKAHLRTIMVGRGKIKTLEPLFPMLLSGQIEHLSMLDATVETLPKGLKFDRYDFIQNLKAYWAGRRDTP